MHTTMLCRALPAALLALSLLSCAGGPNATESENLLYTPGNTMVKHEGGGTVPAPNFALSYYNNGMERYASGNHGSAEGFFTKALEKMKGYEKSYGAFYSLLCYHRGLARSKSRETDGALEDYDAAIAADRRNHLAFYARGMLYRSRNRLSEAIGDFSRVIALKPDYAPAYNQRGIARAVSRKDYGSSIQDLKQALALSPTYQAPLYNLARVYSLSGNAPMAMRHLEQAGALALKSGEDAKRLLETLRSSPEDFKSIRGSAQFGELLERLGKRAE
jgi:tetratricopeptide (TPR) repeat protein